MKTGLSSNVLYSIYHQPSVSCMREKRGKIELLDAGKQSKINRQLSVILPEAVGRYMTRVSPESSQATDIAKELASVARGEYKPVCLEL